MTNRGFAYSRAIDEALAFAAAAHRTQTRKGSDVPYIMHPVHVAMILLRHGFDEEVVMAGLLHDVVEDCDVELDEIRARFGPRVAMLVDAVTERKQTETNERRPWRERKLEQLARLRHANRDEAALKAADALHNCQTTLADLERQGEAAWARFNAGPDEQRWYYGALAAMVRETLERHPLSLELERAVAKLSSGQKNGPHR